MLTKKENKKSFFLKPKTYQLKPISGFTLVELMVSITIFIIVSGIAMVSQGTFKGNILVTNLAYDIALSIRQAQTYGVSVKQNLAGNFNQSYGIHFDSPGYYILFTDLDANGSYDLNGNTASGCVPSSECLKFWRIERGNSIKKFCADARCTDSGLGNDIDGADIIFRRPDPEPIMKAFKSGSLVGTPGNIFITVISPGGAERVVTIRNSGQISVQ